MLVVDGTDAELVRGILETDMLSMEERHKKTISSGNSGESRVLPGV